MTDHFDIEEAFHSQDKKAHRKERKRIQEKDRSKFKKTDQAKVIEKPLLHLGRRGRVLRMTSGVVTVDIEGMALPCGLRGALKQEKTDQKNLVTVGDFVIVDDENQIVDVEERFSFLARKDNLRKRKQQLIASNIDQVLITTSIQDPPIKPSLIDRYIISTLKGNMRPIIVINKIDLAPNDPILKELEATYAKLDIPLIKVSALKKIGMDALRTAMQGKSSVFSGQSGVGKTSLINQVLGTDRRVNEIVDSSRKGSHTTTLAELIPLTDGGFCVDTPGIKSFSLWDISSQELLSYFHDLQEFASDCKFVNCTHVHEPGCRVKLAVENGELSKLRYESYIAIRENTDADQKNPWD